MGMFSIAIWKTFVRTFFDCTFELDLIARKSPFDCGKNDISLKGTYDMQLIMLTLIAMFVSVDYSHSVNVNVP